MSATLMILAELILTSLVEKFVLSPGSPITLELPILDQPMSGFGDTSIQLLNTIYLAQ